MKTVEVQLNYFKQGCDLRGCFRMHAKILYGVAKHLDKIADGLQTHSGVKIKIDGNNHFISISGPRNVVNKQRISNDARRM